ncbi:MULTISPECIES: YceI family protein [Candidatus Microthrix]|mgnify:FL=1|uniref:Lipid/polyisoprenoid-binding YceI-like domain-containing protein n=1 Tax=Candidatus Neomicrothrix parvicella RN1 TaxID=1229780 RepID=R4YWE2_9ACTN|nr:MULTISPECIES: YceI family protein [Microthrix]NLH68203.1 YceI family protein [Candidatus Microthrix parvicella]MBK6503985.1 YceI family protein [Candidatus Microthrix sp.]MBK7019307.1 YceI family protein [Candidatus Microthrix sp.]MBL0204277.1 YceI family protein [Candidatus Microthrix sp.]MBP6134403.1 YceI family protein [Candidatus Microthrix sp.]
MKKPLVIALAVAGALVIAVGGGIAFWALNDSAEDEFQLSETNGGANTSVTTAAAPKESVDEAEATTWKVAEGSQAGYRIDEVLRGLEKTATARTEDVAGSLTLKANTVSDVTVTVQTGTLTSDAALRDDRVRADYLQTDQFPEATFTLDGPLELPGEPTVGDPVSMEAEGTLKLHGVTKDVAVKLDAQLTAKDQLEVVGSTPIALADYKIEVPDISGIVKAAPNGTLEFKLQLTPA